MKGKFWRKALAASLALLIVTGSVPIKPISNLFESMVVTAEAVEEVTKTYDFSTGIRSNDRSSLSLTDPVDNVSKTVITLTDSINSFIIWQTNPNFAPGFISNSTGVEGTDNSVGVDTTFIISPNVDGKVTKIEFSNVARNLSYSEEGATFVSDFSLKIDGMKYNGTDDVLTGIDGQNDKCSFTFISTDEGGISGNLSLILGPNSLFRFQKGSKMIITYVPDEAPVHEHNFSFNASGNTLTATCANDDGLDCSLADSDHKATVTLTANGGHYFPEVLYGASMNLSAFNAITGLNATASTITYTNKETGAATTNYVHDIGHYTASVTISINGTDYELKKNFSIHNGTITCDYPQFSFSPETPSEGDEVTMTFTPQWGDENIQSIIMQGEDGDLTIGNGITDNGDGTYTFTMPEGALFVDAAFSAPTDEHFEQNGNTYTIKSDGGWRYFCKLIREDDTLDGFNGKTVKLATDVESSEMAGTSNHPFKGTFDGQNHTLTFDHEASEDFSAPFHYINGATISNLHVEGTITGGTYESLGGLVGRAEGNITIENCHVSTQISTTYSGSVRHGGVIAEWNSTNATCTVTGCVYDGLIYNPDEAGVTAFCCGFIGWDYGNNGTIKFTDCLSAPAAYGTGKYALGDNCFTFVYPNSEPTLTYSMTNCYYTNTLGNRQGRPAATATTKPANLGAETTNHGLVKGYENGFLYNGNYYTPKYGDAVVDYDFDEWNERASVTFNGDGYNLVGVNITENVEKVSSVTYNRTFTPGATTTVILPFNYDCNGNEGGKFYNFKDVTYDEDQHIWVCKIIAPGEAGSNNVTSLTANTPYLFVPTATKMTFPNIESMTGGVVTLLPTTLNEYGGATTNDNLNFYGTYTGKNWTETSDDYGFAAHGGTAAGGAEEVVAGQFVRYTINASIGPMRCYLRYAGNGALEDTYTVANPGEGDPVRNVPWWDYPDNASAADTYKQISFSAGEGSGTKDVIYIPENRNYILPECNFTAPDGKAFKGWSVKIGDAEAVSKQPGDTIMVMANTTVTAIFEESSTADVTVIAKDTKGEDVGGVALTGTGRYVKNSELTLTAPAAEGYNFVGWYEGETKLCGTNVYTFTVTKNVDFTAKYEALGKVSLTIDGGNSFTINGDAKSTSITAEYTLGTTITASTNTAKFAYWKNSYGMVLSRSASYTFTVTGADTITAVFDTVVENKATLVFESAYGQVMAREQLAEGGSMEIPSLPYRNGYTAKGWDMNGDGVYSADDTVAAAITRGLAATNNMVVISPVYELKNVTYTITVTGGTGGGTYNQNDKVTVTANEPESGKKFSHWTDGTSILSYNASYPFFADRNLTLTAVFVAEETVVEAKGTTEIIESTTDGTKLIYVSMSTVPEGCKIEKAGFIVLKNPGAEMTSEAKFIDTNADYIMANPWDGSAYRYTLSINNTSGATWYVRAYLRYMDANGNTHTVYGSIMHN